LTSGELGRKLKPTFDQRMSMLVPKVMVGELYVGKSTDRAMEIGADDEPKEAQSA
jgi:hypothetical protein